MPVFREGCHAIQQKCVVDLTGGECWDALFFFWIEKMVQKFEFRSSPKLASSIKAISKEKENDFHGLRQHPLDDD